MAVANEALLIDVKVNDESATASVKNLSVTVNNFTQQAQRGFDRAGQSAAKMGGLIEIVARKFSSLGKAAIGIFAADVIAKVFGFSSALDAVRQASDAVATAIARMADRTTEAQKNVKTLREELARLYDEQQKQTQSVRVGKGESRFDVAGIGGLREQIQAQVVVNELQDRLVAIDKKYAEEAKNAPSGITRAGAAFLGLLDFRRSREIDQAISETESRLKRLADAYKATQKAAKEAAEAEKFWSERIYRASRPPLVGATIGAGLRAAGRFAGSVIGGASIALATQQHASALAEVNREAQVAQVQSERYSSALDRERVATEAATRAANIYAQSKRGQIGPAGIFALAGAQVAGQVAADYARTHDAKTLAGQAQTAIDSLAESVKSSLGDQAVNGAFQSFRGFFADVISGSASGAEAFRRFGQSVIASMADILAQQLALRALGFFGLTPWAGPRGGGGVGAGSSAITSSGGGGALPIRSYGSGTGSVSVTLNVGSLDPRTAASVIIENRRAIEDVIASAVSNGTNRGLRLAVRGDGA